jgi:hypothetical protein
VVAIGTNEAQVLHYDRLIRAGHQREEDWRMTGARLRRERENVDSSGSRQMWNVGDWLVAGEDDVFRRMKKQMIRKWASQITGYSQHTLVMAVSVARKIDATQRVDGLSWWHHLAVARLPAPEQARWLCEAAERGWSIRELRERLARSGHTSSRRRPRRGELLIKQVVALSPGEVEEDLLVQLTDWLDRQRRVSTAG